MAKQVVYDALGRLTYDEVGRVLYREPGSPCGCCEGGFPGGGGDECETCVEFDDENHCGVDVIRVTITGTSGMDGTYDLVWDTGSWPGFVWGSSPGRWLWTDGGTADDNFVVIFCSHHSKPVVSTGDWTAWTLVAEFPPGGGDPLFVQWYDVDPGNDELPRCCPPEDGSVYQWNPVMSAFAQHDGDLAVITLEFDP